MSDKHIFETMNGLRGFAALIVVTYHLSLSEPLSLGNGFLAVDLFFVLSGFVIAYSYETRLKNGLSLGDFFLIRLIRLYPLYILGTLLSVLVVAVDFLTEGLFIETDLDAFRSIPWSLLMLPTPPRISQWPQAGLYPLNYPAWSLFFEVLINVIYALTFRWWTETRIFKNLLFFGSALLLSHIIIDTSFDGGVDWVTLEIGFLKVLYSFPAGVLVYRLHKKKFLYPSMPSPIILVIFVSLIMLPSTWGVPFCILIGFPLLVLLAANSKPKGISSSVFAGLGAVSYAMYAIQAPLREFIATVFHKFGLPLGMPVDLALICLIVPICVLADKLYDTPSRKYLARLFLRRSGTSYSGIKTKAEPAAHSLAE